MMLVIESSRLDPSWVETSATQENLLPVFTNVVETLVRCFGCALTLHQTHMVDSYDKSHGCTPGHSQSISINVITTRAHPGQVSSMQSICCFLLVPNFVSNESLEKHQSGLY